MCIEPCLDQFADQVDPTPSLRPAAKRRGKQQPGNPPPPRFDGRPHWYRISGVDFTQVDGLGGLTVLSLRSELGLDASRFPSAKHFAAQTRCRSHSTLGAFYRRIQARMGAPKAITATAHQRAGIFYHL